MKVYTKDMTHGLPNNAPGAPLGSGRGVQHVKEPLAPQRA